MKQLVKNLRKRGELIHNAEKRLRETRPDLTRQLDKPTHVRYGELKHNKEHRILSTKPRSE